MATGDITINGVNFTPEDFDQIAREVTNRIMTTSKDPGQYEEVNSLQGITSIPVFQQSGNTYKLVRVLLSILRGVDGKEIHLQKTDTHIQWRWTDGMWNNLVALKEIKGDSGEKPVFRTSSNGIEWKYQNEEEQEWKLLVAYDILKLSFSDLTTEQIQAFYADIPDTALTLFQQPATEATTRLDQYQAQVTGELTQLANETTQAKNEAVQATLRANEIADHPTKIGEDNYVYKYNEETKVYEKTAIYVKGEKGDKGNLLYASFEVDIDTGELVMITPDDYNGPSFHLSEAGDLVVTIKRIN